MFAVSKKIITRILLLVSLSAPTLAQADMTDACFNFLNAQDYARAESEAKQLLQRGSLDRVEERLAQMCLGQAYSKIGRTQEALPALQRVEALSQTTQELALAYNWLGWIYNNLNDLDKAELYDQRALKAFRELGDRKREATMLNNLAMVANRRGDTERALKLYRESLAMRPKAEQASTLNNIATIYLARKEYKLAIKLMRQAIVISRDNGDTHGTATLQINLGGVLDRDKQFVAAEKELLTGLHSIQLLGDKGGEADAYTALGFLAKDDPTKGMEEAKQWMKKAEALYREIGNNNMADDTAGLLAGKWGQ